MAVGYCLASSQVGKLPQLWGQEDDTTGLEWAGSGSDASLNLQSSHLRAEYQEGVTTVREQSTLNRYAYISQQRVETPTSNKDGPKVPSSHNFMVNSVCVITRLRTTSNTLTVPNDQGERFPS